MNHFEIPIKKVDNAFVHKERDDDIFLYNGRGALPALFTVEPTQLASLADQDLEAIHRCYYEAGTVSGEQTKTYCIKGLPWHVDEESAAVLREHCAAALDTHFAKTGAASYRLKDAAMPECEQQAIASVLSSDVPSEFERYRASNALDKLEGIVRPPVFHVSVYNDTRHYYFYGKRHEHVPGIMIMEIARQAFYAHFYRFNKHTRDSVSLSILRFGSEFIDYTNSNYPTLIAVETLSVDVEKAGRETHKLRATFTQRGAPVSVVEMVGTVVGIKLFKKFRNIKPPVTDLFALIRNDIKIAVLVRGSDERYVEGYFSRMSVNTLLVRLPASAAGPDHGASCAFFLFSPHFGIISGDGACDHHDNRAGEGEIAIRITDWASGAESKAREFIKMDCYLVEQRCSVAS